MEIRLRKFVKRDEDQFPVVKINDANREKRFALFHKAKRHFSISTIFLSIFAFLTLLALTVLLGSPEICSAKRSFTPQLHVVKRGETLSGIALRYGVSIAQLRRWNGLRGDNIREGQHLQIRPKSTAEYVVRSGDTLSEIAENYGVSMSLLRRLNDISKNRIYVGQRLMLKSTNDRRETRQIPTNEDAERFEYIVKKGDNLSKISERFQVGLDLLRQLNSLKKDIIFPGQRLRLRPSSLEEPVHIVRPGETLSAIAAKYGIKVSDLVELNGIEGSKIMVGEELRLKKESANIHIVERGDALWEIARAYGISVKQLKRLNGLTADQIYPGQKLQLPVEKPEYEDTYVVKKGDFLGRIARLHQMSVADLKRMNGLHSSLVYPGQRLKVNPLLNRGREWPKISKVDWDDLMVSLSGTKKIATGNGPYYRWAPKATRQKSLYYYENPDASPLKSYRQARKLWKAFEKEVDSLGRLSNILKGWHIVLDPGHGGLDPGAIVENLDGNGNKVYVVEDEYVYDIALRVYVLLRVHGAAVTMTLLSPNHLIRHSDPPTRTYVNEKNEVYNSYAFSRANSQRSWPSGGRNGNLLYRVRIARRAFKNVPRNRRIFLSLHADIERESPDATVVLYYESKKRGSVDFASRNFARSILPELGAGAYARGQYLGVLKRNPAAVKVIVEVRNLAYTDAAWAIRFEQLRYRDAEKIVKGVLTYTKRHTG
jgi:N-acetylmuramoyl-L-alanine amidase